MNPLAPTCFAEVRGRKTAPVAAEAKVESPPPVRVSPDRTYGRAEYSRETTILFTGCDRENKFNSDARLGH
jgi:hypothetical protein